MTTQRVPLQPPLDLLVCFLLVTAPAVASAQTEPEAEPEVAAAPEPPVPEATAEPPPEASSGVEVAEALAEPPSDAPVASAPPAESPEDAPAVQVLEPAPAAAEPVPAKAVDAPLEMKPGTNSSGGFLDFNFYPYMTEVDSDTVFTLNSFAKLPYGFSYFSLLNIANEPEANPFQDTVGFYTEQNLRFTPFDVVPVDLTIQYNMRSGADNDRLRFGFRWRFEGTPYLDVVLKAIHLAYSINFHVVQLDHEDAYVWQMEHVWKLSTPYLDNRLYFAGFADHTMNGASPPGAPSNPVVLEAQLGVRLVDELHGIAEYRINQYRVDDETNLALGGQYIAKW